MSGFGSEIEALPVVSGSITGNAQTVNVPVGNAGFCILVVSGTYTSVALAFEGSCDGTTWVTVQGARTDTSGIETATGTITSIIRAWEFCANGYKYLRVRATAYTSGTMNVLFSPSASSVDPVPAISLAAGSAAIGSLAAGTAIIGYTALGTKTTGGATIAKLISAATTNATSLKASAGTLYGAHATNNGAGFAYVKFYNKASAPTVGTDVPVAVLGLPPNSSIPLLADGIGSAFATGIAYAITGGMADTDTTAVALNQVALTVRYA